MTSRERVTTILSGGVPVWDIRAAAGGDTDMLVRTPALGRALAQTLGTRPVVLMRGHGVGEDDRALRVGPVVGVPVVVHDPRVGRARRLELRDPHAVVRL